MKTKQEQKTSTKLRKIVMKYLFFCYFIIVSLTYTGLAALALTMGPLWIEYLYFASLFGIIGIIGMWCMFLFGKKFEANYLFKKLIRISAYCGIAGMILLFMDFSQFAIASYPYEKGMKKIMIASSPFIVCIPLIPFVYVAWNNIKYGKLKHDS